MGKIVPRRPPSRDVQSDDVFEDAKYLIDKCMNSNTPHGYCQYSRDTVLPKRVIDTGEPGDPHPIVKLRVNETEYRERYLVLSYCWGEQQTIDQQSLRLHKDNLPDLIDQIPIESLQQSIQDAIWVTRKLGFRYLWVDALCIIQDSGSDKEIEVRKMASIFKNAAITIAASSSRHASLGFLSKRDRPYQLNDGFRIPMLNKENGTVYLSVELYEPEHPLDTRGWAFQESLLSSRMLIFSDYELLWQCKEVELQSVTGLGLEYQQLLHSLPWSVFADDKKPDFGREDPEKLYLWKSIIHEYTSRELSNAEDRLNALAGVTSELETLWHDISLYGIWRKWFIQLLAWYKLPVDREKKRCLQRAPSWSWASLNSVIYYMGYLQTEHALVKPFNGQPAQINCQTLKEADIQIEKCGSILEMPDLLDPSAELSHLGPPDRETEYLLLGTSKTEHGVDEGIGLLSVETGKGVYRRLGLVVFKDMSLWKDATKRDITLEPKLEG